MSNTIIISEIADRGTSDDACDGNADWIELRNIASSDVSLQDFKLHDDNGANDASAYVFASNAKLKAGAFLVLCAGVDGDDKSPQFKIGGADTITLRNAAGEVVSTSGKLQDKGEFDMTWAYNSKKSSYEYTATPTPGRANVLTFTNKWSRERVRLAKQHEDGEAFFESNSLPAANRLPPVVELRLTFSAKDWAYQQANVSYELYKPFIGLKVTSKNGRKLHAKLSAGGRARPRGQSTNTVPVCMGIKTFPWIIDVAGGADSRQRLFGMGRFYLRNHLGDASYMREWTMHRMLRRFDLPYLRTRTVKLFINGEYTGLYSLMEAPDQDYVFYRSFGVDNTNTKSTEPPFAQGHALYKAKSHAIMCGEVPYGPLKLYYGITDADLEARRGVDPKQYAFIRGEHKDKTPVKENMMVCHGLFTKQMKKEFTDAMVAWEKSGKDCGKMALKYGRVERDFGGSDRKTDNNDDRMMNFFNTYLAGPVVYGCGAACDSDKGIYASLRNTPLVDVAQWIKNMAVYAVAQGEDSPLGNGNNFYMASPGGSSESERAYRLVQWDHNNAFSSTDLCSAECNNPERALRWSIARPTCRSLGTNPYFGPLVAGEGNKRNMEQYLAYVQQFNQDIFTNPKFIAIVEAHAQAISAAVSEDPGRVMHDKGYEDEVSASAGNWEEFNLIAYMQARGKEVNKQIAAIQDGTFPRMDKEVPDMEPCQDWRRETAAGGAYVEDGIHCTPASLNCLFSSACFEEGPGGLCDAETGRFRDSNTCPIEMLKHCRACFPYSMCGPKGNELREKMATSSSTFVEDGKMCSEGHRACEPAYACFDENDGGLCDATTGQFKSTKKCDTPTSLFCRGCFPHSMCGSKGDVLRPPKSKSAIYEEDGDLCGTDDQRRCMGLHACFDESIGVCNLLTGQFMTPVPCELAVEYGCRNCFPNSMCGAKGDALRAKKATASSTYVEDGKFCHEEHRGCETAKSCFDENYGGLCDVTTGEFKDTQKCPKEVLLICRGCFPHSICGSKSGAMQPPKSKSATYEEDGKICTADHKECLGAGPCFDESTGFCNSLNGQFTNTEVCNEGLATHCGGCFPYSKCGSKRAAPRDNTRTSTAILKS